MLHFRLADLAVSIRRGEYQTQNDGPVTPTALSKRRIFIFAFLAKSESGNFARFPRAKCLRWWGERWGGSSQYLVVGQTNTYLKNRKKNNAMIVVHRY